MDWAFVWMMFVLKIPIFFLGWIVWHAIKSVPAPDEGVADSGGGGEHPRPRRPRPTRRGPHGEPLPSPPARVRAVAERRPSVR